MSVVADIAIMPVGKGTSLSEYVKRAIKELKKSVLKIDVGAMSTSVEAQSTEQIFKAFEKAKDVIFEMQWADNIRPYNFCLCVLCASVVNFTSSPRWFFPIRQLRFCR